MTVDPSHASARPSVLRTALAALLVCAGYYLAGIVGLVSRFPSSGISTLWPATAMLLVALLVTPPRTWWVYLLVLLPVHLHLVRTFQGSVPLLVMLCQYAGNVAHALLAAVILRGLVDVSARFEDLRSMSVFIVLAAIGSSWLVSAATVYLFNLAGWVDDYWLAWKQRSLSNGLGTLLVTPLVLWTVTGGPGPAYAAPLRRKLEFILLIAGLIVVGVPVLSRYLPDRAYSPLLPLTVLPLLLWGSVRFVPAGLCMMLLVVGMLSLSGAITGRGPFVSKSPVENTLDLQLFLFAAATPLLLLSALVQERRRGMFALRESEARYRSVVEDQTELICRFLPDGVFTFVNGAYCRYFQRSPDELLGKNFWEFIPPEAHKAARAHLAAITHQRPVATIEHQVVAPGGEIRWQQWTDRGFFDEQGRIVEYQAVGRDITERKLAEDEHRQLEAQKQVAEALRVSEARFRQLADAMPQIVWTARPDGSVDYFNRKWYALTGVEECPPGDVDWLPVLHPDDRQSCQQLWQQSMHSGRPYEMEVRLKLVSSPEHRWHLARALPVRDEAGNIVRWYGTCTDVHDQKLTEQALRQSEANLRDANRAKDRFLAALSHELRTPLTPVLLAAEAHRHDPNLPDELCRDLNTIYTNAALEVALIDDLLDLTRVGCGKIELNRAPVDVHTLLQQTAHTCSDETFRGKSLRISLELGANRHWVMGDPTRLSQVFWNIIKNAIKFSDPGALVTVRTRDADELCIEVIDTGFGIEPAELPRIFDAFEQGGRDITRRFGGMGLGLALSKAFAEMHGGRISAASRGRGRGAVFRVDLPAIDAPEPSWQPSDRRGSTSRGQSDAPPPPAARILLVEDHEFTANLLARLLRACGHDVLSAHSVAAAIEAAAHYPIDLVISDLGLPDGTGLELMSRLAREHGLRGIALSGYGTDEDLRQSREAGFVEHLIKPVDVEGVKGAIARALARDATT